MQPSLCVRVPGWDKALDAIGTFFKGLTWEKIKELMAEIGEKVNRYELAHFAGSVVLDIIVGVLLAIFTGGAGNFAQLAAKGEKLRQLLKLILREAISLITFGIYDLARILRAFFERLVKALSQGFEGLYKFFKQMIFGFFEVAEDGKKVLSDIDEKAIDWLKREYKIGSLGGKILTTRQIRRLKAILSEAGVTLIQEEKVFFKKKYRDLFNEMHFWNRVGGFNRATREFYLTKNATELIAFHEQCHVQHWKRLGDAEYAKLSILEKEAYVWEQISKNKEKWTQLELEDALAYINRKRRDVNLEPIKL